MLTHWKKSSQLAGPRAGARCCLRHARFLRKRKQGEEGAARYMTKASFSSSSRMAESEPDSMAATAPRAAWLETPYPRTLRNELMSSAACQESRPDCSNSSRNEERSVAVNFSIAFGAGESISMAILLLDSLGRRSESLRNVLRTNLAD